MSNESFKFRICLRLTCDLNVISSDSCNFFLFGSGSDNADDKIRNSKSGIGSGSLVVKKISKLHTSMSLKLSK